MRRQTVFIRNVLETASRNYGSPGDLIIIRDTIVVDKDTLQETVTKQDVRIRRPVVMDSNASRRFVQRLASVVANREFSYGMIFDQNDRDFFVTAAQMGSFVPQDSDYMVWASRRWEIISVQRFELDTGWVIRGREVKGNRVQSVESRKGRNRLAFGQSAVREP